jgi:hypothetical protein
VPAITYYVLFLRLHPSHHIRYVLPIYVLLAWPAGKLAAECLAAGRLARIAGGGVLAAVLGYAVLQGFSVGTLYNRDGRYALHAWLRDNVPPGTRVVGIAPEYGLPRFPAGLRVTRRTVWDWNGDQIDDIRDVDAEYVVLGMSAPRRIERAETVERFLRERGYRRDVEFKAPVPMFGREIPDLHSINPRVVVFRRAGRLAGASGG